MALNLIEMLKISSRDENPYLKHFTGSQNFLENNMTAYQDFSLKYLDVEKNCMPVSQYHVDRSKFESFMNIFNNYMFPRHDTTLVGKVPKISPNTHVYQFKHRIGDLTDLVFLRKNDCVEVVTRANLYNPQEQKMKFFSVTTDSNSNRTDSNNSFTEKSTGSSECSQNLNTTCQKSANMVPESVGILNVTEDPKKHKSADNGTLNEELANRKTKEMQKRSKKRRRRQKKNSSKLKSPLAPFGENSTNINAKAACSNACAKNLPKQDCERLKTSFWQPKREVAKVAKQSDAVSSNTPVKPKNQKKESTMPTCSFISGITHCDILCDTVNKKDDAKSVQIISNVSSFVFTVDSASEDSDWDEISGSETLNDASEFEFSGLFVANLTIPKTNTSFSTTTNYPSSDEDDLEFCELNMQLIRVNNEWNEANKNLDKKLRSIVKVSFAPDANLVEVFPVDAYDRKGEWEICAIERLRFKKRINELEKIISPCLSQEHRAKTFKNLNIAAS